LIGTAFHTSQAASGLQPKYNAVHTVPNLEAAAPAVDGKSHHQLYA
jgi:hypothetical protein